MKYTLDMPYHCPSTRSTANIQHCPNLSNRKENKKKQKPRNQPKAELSDKAGTSMLLIIPWQWFASSYFWFIQWGSEVSLDGIAKDEMLCRWELIRKQMIKDDEYRDTPRCTNKVPWLHSTSADVLIGALSSTLPKKKKSTGKSLFTCSCNLVPT